jgi:hypothetical protein
VTTARDLAGELRLPVGTVLTCLLDFGRPHTVVDELDKGEITLIRDNAEALKSAQFVRGRTPDLPPPGSGPDMVGVREPRRPRPSQGAAGAIPPDPPPES